MFVLGLTGSIGMGKSTAAAFFAEAGVPVHDADAAVHRLYQGEAAALIEAAFPGTTAGGKVDRAALAQHVLEDPAAIHRLEEIIHPLVRESETRFLAAAAERGEQVAVLDIPLLFETGAENRVDAVVVVSAGPDIQRTRALARSGMTAAKLEAILANQMPDQEKRRRAHFLVDSSGELDSTRAQVRGILRAVVGLPGRFV
jgi:dephospho-CoA kinase